MPPSQREASGVRVLEVRFSINVQARPGIGVDLLPEVSTHLCEQRQELPLC
jgi:hypothetical protein